MKFINIPLLSTKLALVRDDLNKLFINANLDIKNLLKSKNICTRNRVLTFYDVLCYKFNYISKYNTQLSAINNYKFINNINCNNSAFYRKENNIPLEYYCKIYNDILNLHNKYYPKNGYNIVAVDGTYNNTNIENNKKLETSLNMGYYDVTNGIPIELTFKGKDFKNKEIESLIDKIKDNELNMSSVILVLDRAYGSYKLMNFLQEKNIKFVIRIKNNFKCIKDGNINTYNDNFRLINYNYNVSSSKKLENKKKAKIELYNITVNINCNVITNLDLNLYTDDQIKDIYNSRWKVEEFFKLIKSNFNFANLKEHNHNAEITHKKSYYSLLIICNLQRIIEKIFMDHINLNKHNKDKYNININKSSLIRGIRLIIDDIIHSKLEKNKLLQLGEAFITLNYCKKDCHNPRISKTPFTKWYVKDYHYKYDLEKIFDAYLNDDTTKINKNLKMKLKNYTFKLIE